MYKNNSIIIVAEKKEKFIEKTINSCLTQIGKFKIKIYVVYSSLLNEEYLKKKFRKNRNIFFLKCVNKKKFHTWDQIYKIGYCLKYCRDGTIYLLDGDDIFANIKIKVISNTQNLKNEVLLHNHNIIIENKIQSSLNKNYKRNFFFNLFFNDWPENINTSSIVIDSKLLRYFYKNYNPYKWRYLAIDVQLILFFKYRYQLKIINKVLTYKRENINNFDKLYSNIFKKIYWQRRLEQHKFTKELSNKLGYLDYFITLIILNFLKN